MLPIIQIAPSPPDITYDYYWVETVVIRAPSPLGEASASVRLVPASIATGAVNQAGAIGIELNDLFAEMSTNAKLAAAFEKVIKVIRDAAIERGIAAAPNEES